VEECMMVYSEQIIVSFVHWFVNRMRVFDINGTKMFDGVHRTNGIDVYVTGERTILLDSQVFVIVMYFCCKHCLGA